MDRIRTLLRRTRADANVARLRRRKKAAAFIYRNLSKLTAVVLAIGYLWIIVIPTPSLSQGTYIDENALQPAQVNTFWSWQDVHRADQHLRQLEGLCDRNSTSEQRAQFIRDQFAKLGLTAATQTYTFTASSGDVSGVNAYAVMASPRTTGSEAMVVSASWISESGDGAYNLRGISIVLALASFLKNYSLWAKDIIFVIGDGRLDGMHAWLNAYHGTIPSNLETDLLEYTSGVIWTSLNIDYSSHSFSHIGLFFEGLNGRLPNQDLLNSVRLISHYTGGVPMVIYDYLEEHETLFSSENTRFMPKMLDFIRQSPQLSALQHRARNVVRHVSYQSRGEPSGAHGLFHRFRIDAITLYAVPAVGPHGFFALGRTLESTLRTMNNLLERLHASFFFYILTSPDTFMKIGMFLPSVVLIAVAMMFWGLRNWVEAGWAIVVGLESHSGDVQIQKQVGKTGTPNNDVQIRWQTRQRPVFPALVTIAVTHAMGILAFNTICSYWFFRHRAQISSPIIFAVLTTLPVILCPLVPAKYRDATSSSILKSFNLCLASTMISITSLLNFSLAALLAIILGIPLVCSPSSRSMNPTSLSRGPSSSQRPSPSACTFVILARYTAYSFLAWGWLVLLPAEVERSIWNWEVLGVWFAPFVCIVYAPLVVQAGMVGLWRK
ncbi:Gaa1-like protein [Phlebopus sp. FC_14]|nr:Gaa1-like protein [Phlebopus sp. FC_14]